MASTSDNSNAELQKLYGKDVFRCEALRSHRGTGKGRKYLVKWLGYPESGNTWEPEVNIIDKNLIAAYEEKLKSSTLAPPKPRVAAPKRRQPIPVRTAKPQPNFVNKKMKIDNGPVGQVSNSKVEDTKVEVEKKGEELKNLKVDLGSSSSESVLVGSSSSESVPPSTATASSSSVEEKPASIADGQMQQMEDIIDLSQGKSAINQQGSLVVDGHLESSKEEPVKDSIENPSNGIGVPLTASNGIEVPLSGSSDETPAPLEAAGGAVDLQNGSEIPQPSGIPTPDGFLPSSSVSSSGRNASVIVSLPTTSVELPTSNGNSSEPHNGDEGSSKLPVESFQEFTEVTTGDGKSVTFRETVKVLD